MNKFVMMIGSLLLIAAGGRNAEAATVDAGPVVQNSNAMGAADQVPAKMSIRQQIQDQLSKAGYTAVDITPSSFLIRAKDKQGNPVEMVVGPDSLTEITEVTPSKDAATSAAKTSTPAGATTAPKAAQP